LTWREIVAEVGQLAAEALLGVGRAVGDGQDGDFFAVPLHFELVAGDGQRSVEVCRGFTSPILHFSVRVFQ